VKLYPLLLAAVGYLGLRVRRLEHALAVDAKTGLRNGAAWHADAARELARASRTRTRVAVLVLDIDRFRSINSSRGHLGGDHVLRAVAACLRDGVRPFDVVGRFGGDEFVVLLADTSPSSARAVTERLRRAVSRRTGCTVSVGVACAAADGTSSTDLVAAADSALFEAKAAGGDSVCFAQPTRKPRGSSSGADQEWTTSLTPPGE
jgi:diguanylate cyclase (GGDEF)-like protein